LRLIIRRTFSKHQRLSIEQIDKLCADARKVAAKANSALDIVVRAEREFYHIDEFTGMVAEVDMLLSKLDECRAVWNMEKTPD
jgi:hypothetical protein